MSIQHNFASISTAIYTCSVNGFDWIHRPAVRPSSIDFVRFSDRRPWRSAGWEHRNLPHNLDATTPRVKSRFPKICPYEVLTGYDIVVWVDSNIEIIGDVRPLIEEFLKSGAHIAMFPHPSGRTVDEEIKFAKQTGKITSEFYAAAEMQRKRYAAAQLLNKSIIEATIIFYRLSSVEISRVGDIWWREITKYTERDQISQPFAMLDTNIKVYLWDWHFDNPNPYFRRVPHRPKSFLKRMQVGAHFLSESRVDFRFVRLGINGARRIKRLAEKLHLSS